MSVPFLRSWILKNLLGSDSRNPAFLHFFIFSPFIIYIKGLEKRFIYIGVLYMATNNNISVYENDIQYYISMFCEENKIDDIKNISQSVYNGLLMYVCKKYIKPSELLKLKDRYNSYNVSEVEKLCDYYIYLCAIYDKECSIVGFSYLSGIDSSVFYEWENNYNGRYGDGEASAQRSEIAKKLRFARENSLSDKLLTGKNPVGVLGILNHFYSWNMPGVRSEKPKTTAISLDDMQKQVGLLSDNLTQQAGKQEPNGSLKSSDNLTQL